jgi:hypothetical protein
LTPGDLAAVPALGDIPDPEAWATTSTDLTPVSTAYVVGSGDIPDPNAWAVPVLPNPPVLSVGIASGLAVLTWTQPTDFGPGESVANYFVWRSTNGGSAALVETLAGNVLTWTDPSALPLNDTYTYYVIAAIDISVFPLATVTSNSINFMTGFTYFADSSWSPPTGAEAMVLNSIEVYAIGGGGGGGAGADVLNSGEGGFGGCGGGFANGSAPVSALSAPVTITIGAGGAFATPASVYSDTNNSGGATTFGPYITCTGGGRGQTMLGQGTVGTGAINSAFTGTTEDGGLGGSIYALVYQQSVEFNQGYGIGTVNAGPGGGSGQHSTAGGYGPSPYVGGTTSTGLILGVFGGAGSLNGDTGLHPGGAPGYGGGGGGGGGPGTTASGNIGADGAAGGPGAVYVVYLT